MMSQLDHRKGEELLVGREHGAYCTCAYRACCLTFKTLEALERHITVNHNMSWDSYTRYTAGKGDEVDEDDETTSKRKDAYCVCTYMECGRKFKTLKALEEHVVLYHNISWQNYTMYYHRWVRKEPSKESKSPVKMTTPKLIKDPDKHMALPEAVVSPPRGECKPISGPGLSLPVSEASLVQHYIPQEQMLGMLSGGQYPYYGTQLPMVSHQVAPTSVVQQMLSTPMWQYMPSQISAEATLPVAYAGVENPLLIDPYTLISSEGRSEILNLSKEKEGASQLQLQKQQQKEDSNKDSDNIWQQNIKDIQEQYPQHLSGSNLDHHRQLLGAYRSQRSPSVHSIQDKRMESNAKNYTNYRATSDISNDSNTTIPKIENGMYIIEPKSEVLSNQADSCSSRSLTPGSSISSSRTEPPVVLEGNIDASKESILDHKQRKKAKTVREFLSESQIALKSTVVTENNGCALKDNSAENKEFALPGLVLTKSDGQITHTIESIIGSQTQTHSHMVTNCKKKAHLVQQSANALSMVGSLSSNKNKFKVMRLPIRMEALYSRYLKKKYFWLITNKEKWKKRDIFGSKKIKRIKMMKSKHVAGPGSVKGRSSKSRKNHKNIKNRSKVDQGKVLTIPSYMHLYRLSRCCLGCKVGNKRKINMVQYCKECRSRYVWGRVETCEHDMLASHGGRRHLAKTNMLHAGHQPKLHHQWSATTNQHLTFKGTLLKDMKGRCDSPLKVLTPEEQQLQAETSFRMLTAEQLVVIGNQQDGNTHSVESCEDKNCDDSHVYPVSETILHNQEIQSQFVGKAVQSDGNFCDEEASIDNGRHVTPKWPMRIEQLQSEAEYEKKSDRRSESTGSLSTADSREIMDQFFIQNFAPPDTDCPAYKCGQCSLTYYGNKDYITHLFEDHQMYKCVKCEDESSNSSHIYRYEETIQNHLEMVHGIKETDTDISVFFKRNIFAGLL